MNTDLDIDSDLQLIEALNTVALSDLPGQIVSLARSTVPEHISRVEEALADPEAVNATLADVFRKTLAKEKTRYDKALAMHKGDNTDDPIVIDADSTIVVEADSTGQISIVSFDENGSDHELRICGPKFNDITGHFAARVEISWKDADAIRQHLDAISFPGGE